MNTKLNTSILDAIEKAYQLQIKQTTAAPRGFVAETFVLTTAEASYFCKLIEKPLFIPKIKQSLPVLETLYAHGFTQLNYPIRTADGRLWVETEQALIVLFNYIDAPQSYAYDEWTFGHLLGQLHQMTPSIQAKTAVPQFNFRYENQLLFEHYVDGTLNNSPADEITRSLQTLLQQYEPELQQDLTAFQQVMSTCSTQTFLMVLTHGDAPGNTLVSSPTNLYLIDWDDLLLAPPERDIWFLDHSEPFMAGYRAAVPAYQPNPLARRFMVYQRYFDDIVEYCAEILGDYPTSHRLKNLHLLEHNCFKGWCRAAVRALDV